jgi:DNA repair protein SbcC/Rad50
MLPVSIKIKNIGPYRDFSVNLEKVPGPLVAVTGRNGCLSGDTLIDIPRNLSINPYGIPLKSLVGTTPLLYAYNQITHKMVLARAISVHKTAESVPVYAVEFTIRKGIFSGIRKLVGTKDHPVMMHDGSYRPLGDLRKQDSLMPLYRRSRDGQYASILHPDGTLQLEHRLILGLSDDDHVGHHLDKNTYNNEIGNLSIQNPVSHGIIHGKEHPVTYDIHPRGMLGKKHSEASKEAIRNSLLSIASNQDWKEKRTAALRAYWESNYRPWADKTVLEDLYLNRRMSAVEIGASFGVSDTIIGQYLRRFGIPVRSLKQSQMVRFNHCVLAKPKQCGEEDVYDIIVPDYNNFVANGIVVHNSGKTFLMECIFASLFRTLPTRPAGIYKYCTARHAGIEFTFDLAGHRYTSILKIDSQALKMEAVLKQHGVDKPLNDGKVRTYDPIIEKLLGSEKQALISSFAAQDQAGSFLQIEKSERKSLFIKMLGLEKLQNISVSAGKRADELRESVAKHEGRRSAHLAISLSTPPFLPGLEDAKARASEKLAAHKDRYATTLESVSETKARCAGADDLQVQRKSLCTRRQEITDRISQNDAEITRDRAELAKLGVLQDRIGVERKALQDNETLLPHITERLAKLSAQISRITTLQQGKVTLEQRINKSKMELSKVSNDLRQSEILSEQLPALLEARDRLGQTQQQRTVMAEETNRFRGELSGLLKNSKEATERIRVLEVDLNRHRAAETAARTRLETAREDSLILAAVPCQGAGEYGQCRFLVRGTEAAANMDDYQSTMDNAVACGLGVQKQIDALPKVAQSSIEALEQRIRNNDEELRRLDRSLLALKKSISTLPQAEAAGHRVALLREQVSGLDQSLAVLEIDLEAVQAELHQCGSAADEAKSLQSERIGLEAAIVRSREVIQVLSDQIAKSAGAEERIRNREALRLSMQSDLEAVLSDVSRVDTAIESIRSYTQKLVQLQVDLDLESNLIDRVTDELRLCESDLAVAVDRVRAIAQAKEALAAIDAELAPLHDDIAAYRALQEAFGPMEIQSFEIDAAGPAISTLANDLYFTCFGPRFSVKFVTRTLLADGSGFKDAFDIIVTDQDNCREGSIDDLSGGQKVIVSEGVRLAIALYNKQKNDVSWDALFRDEASSALDDINAPHYIAMLKQAREIGRFKKVYFVSHQGRVQESADSRIRIQDGAATIEA